ncbi:MAG: ATP-binding cassette domain-containing protein [Lutibacter sp.]|uniref:sulfate/molybdate ABC transporter ATP-binding protein n=1 Tax=Lutibacter sp. TaxID=1925666 RepID=UPI00299D40CB|nr:ATP-binding cassette domain-containing protein [Lutibacter sp.]MDX1830376.1 ATP-binding cassette domain-containing protein [Lutibacter sp.]
MIQLNIQKKLKAASGEMELAINTQITQGDLVSFYGKSGAGKTTILRILAGLLKPEKGEIIVQGNTWLNTSKKINLKPQQRKVGYVFQDYSLFPNMTVKENLEFALTKNQDKKIISELIEIVELGNLRDRKPETLSGGQKQRVALARALVQKPSILMLDEPLSALDSEIRYKLQQHILQVHNEFKLTTILISHDISEILRMSDYLFELECGKIIRQGKPSELFKFQNLNAKFQFTGDLVAIEKQDFLYILTIKIGKDIVKVIADETEGVNLVIGDKILVASKAFNPIIHKINK